MAQLWNLGTNLPVGPPLQHEDGVECAAFSTDGKMLVTGCNDKNVYAWDIHTILKTAGLELPIASTNIQPSTPSRLDLHALFACLSPLLPRSRRNTDEETDPHPTAPSGSRPDALRDLLSSLFRSQPHANEEIELPQRVSCPYVVEVAAMRDSEVCLSLVCQSLASGDLYPGVICCWAAATHSAQWYYCTRCKTCVFTTRPTVGSSRAFFYCCASPQHANANAQSTQQHGQSQGPVQTQVSSLETQPAAPSTSTTPTAPDTHTTAPVAATA
ncbi:hypothetical protein EV702DRAFT_105777 [Suillus placidus]|uniref:Uncharacterized protein n=1 Tax=Suillus placidus TaxID=48579 RepID=A0A9P7CV52_9AGAM|nr:hypothetical protein EV702DRAFT_105777 [Suillus placidus]